MGSGITILSMKKTFLMILSLAAAMSVQAFGNRMNPQVREYQFSSFDKPDPRVTVTHIHGSDGRQSICKAKCDEESANTVPVNIRFLRNNQFIKPEKIVLMNSDDTFYVSLEVDNEGKCTADLQEGTFDICFQMQEIRYFDENDPAQGYVRLGHYFYFMDDVAVCDGMPEIEVDIRECHPIKLDFHLANDDLLQPDLVDTTDPDNPVVVTPGNIGYSSLALVPYNIDKQRQIGERDLGGMITDYASLQTKGLESHTVYVNESSDRWCFYGNWHYANADISEIYLFSAMMKPSDVKVSMTASDQILLPWNFARTKTYGDNADKRVYCSSIDIMFGSDKPGAPSGGSMLRLQTETPKVYVAVKCDDLLRTGYILHDIEMSNDWGWTFGIGSCEMTVADGKIKYLQTQRGDFGAILMSSPYDDTIGITGTHDVFFRGHKRFSSNADGSNFVFGKTAPILRVVNDISYDKNNNDAYSNRLSPAVVGQYGEIRTIDVESNMTTKFTYNGEVVKENHVGDPIVFCMDWNQAGHGKGVMEYEMLTENTFEDGIEGYNRTYIYTDQTKDDPTAPTITHLMCRDSDDRISNRFSTPDKGVVEFSASDFSSEEFWVPEGWNFTWFDSHPIQEVKSEWSPYGENDWNEFAVEEVPEYFENGFGTFYRGSLAGVNKGSSNGWYDLRITLCDATGNKQQQTISPVFRIESMSGVETLGITDADAPVEYYNLQGFRVNTATPGEIVIKRQGNHVSKQLMK